MTWLHRYTVLLAAATLLLVAAGGMVTSTSSGLSVPDWPTTYGYNMFTFPASKMVGGIFYEHGHRLIASTVGFLTIGLVFWQWRVERRRQVRRIGWLALAAVVLQGVLGGLTVIFLLPDAISIAHAGLAQLFFALTVTLALLTSARWRQWTPAGATEAGDRLLRRLTITTAALVYMQILIGATMRHMGAGLAIPDFPWMFGHVLPPVWTAPIAIHFAHRLGAVIVTLAVLATAGHVWYHHRSRPWLTRPAAFLVVAVLTQATLGAFVVLTAKDPVVNTIHVAVGALVFVTSVVLALRANRAAFSRWEAAAA